MRSFLVGVIALLALTLIPLGLAVGSPSADNGPSGAASPGASTAGRCSLAEANAVVERLHLNDGLVVAKPANRVLCGPFVGPGSNAMVASLSRETCLPNFGWAVFRFAGGDWQLVMKRNGFAILSKAGSDIREEVPVYRSGDSPCFPKGGTKARIWQWNGSRLSAGPWRQATPGVAPATEKSGFFKTPSANIVCGYFVGPDIPAGAVVYCGIKSGLKPAPPRRPCDEGGYAGDRVDMNATGRVSVPPCAGDPGALVGESRARVLGYGKTWSGGGIRCSSALTGLTCRNKSGHGFFLSRERWRKF